MFALFNGPMSAWTFVDLLILVVILAACCGLVAIALRQFGVTLPPWVVQVIMIVVVAVVVILAIKLVAGLL